MRDQWYGDKRDIVKWATLVHLAREQAIKTIFWVVFYRPDDKPEPLRFGKQTFEIPTEVWQHFRNIRHIKRLQKATNLKIKIFREPWGKGKDRRSSYIKRATQKLSAGRRGRAVVLLDPDTGISTEDSEKHVSNEAVGKIYRALRTGDTLVLYQHAQRYNKDWHETTRKRFADAIEIPVEKARMVQSKIASDVAFFVATKSTK